MNLARKWTTVLVGCATGILLIACTGETSKPESPPPPAAVVPASDAVVYTEPFSSPAGQEWLMSRYSMSKHFENDDELAWANVAGDQDGSTFEIARSGCTTQYGEPIHCHLKVIEVSPGQSVPKLTFHVKPGSNENSYDIKVRTKGEGEQTDLMICKDVAEVEGNDQSISGDCEIYDDNQDPAHKFCAHTERDREQQKVVIWFEFGHGTCSQTSGPIHNGTGHTHPKNPKE